MSYQLATAKIWNGSTWVNASSGADIYQATDGTDVPYMSTAVTVTASATTHTKGAWVEVIASTAFQADRLMLNFGANATTNVNSSALCDIGIGAAGSETVLIENIGCGFTAFGLSLDFPVRIPSGTRIAARMQSAIASKTMTVAACVGRTKKSLVVAPSTSISTFGASTATSRGTSFTAANGSKGSWVQLTADCGTAKKYLFVEIQGNGNNNWQAYNFTVDIGIGAAGSETVLIPNIRVATSTSEVVNWTSQFHGFFVSIPANSRIAIRSQSTSVQTLDAIIHTVSEVGSF